MRIPMAANTATDETVSSTLDSRSNTKFKNVFVTSRQIFMSRLNCDIAHGLPESLKSTKPYLPYYVAFSHEYGAHETVFSRDLLHCMILKPTLCLKSRI